MKSVLHLFDTSVVTRSFHSFFVDVLKKGDFIALFLRHAYNSDESYQKPPRPLNKPACKKFSSTTLHKSSLSCFFMIAYQFIKQQKILTAQKNAATNFLYKGEFFFVLDQFPFCFSVNNTSRGHGGKRGVSTSFQAKNTTGGVLGTRQLF